MRLRALALLALAASSSAYAQAPPSKTLERGLKLYDKRDYFSATIELERVLTGESGDNDEAKQRARFFMGKTLYQLKLYAPALAHFQYSVEDPTNPYHVQVVKWLAAIQGPAAEPLLHTYDMTGTASLDSESLDAVRYATGHYAEVTEASRYWPSAQLVQARVAFARGEIDRGIALATAAARDPKAGGEAARAIADGAGLRGRDALVKLPDAMGPYLASRLAVEASGRLTAISDPVVLATACLEGPADNIVPRLETTTRDTLALLEKINADDDNAEVYEHVRHIRGNRPAEVAVRLALATRELHELAVWDAELHAELDLVQRADKAWQTTQIAAEIMQELTVQSSILAADIGKLEHERLVALQKVLAHAFAGTRMAVAVGPKVRDGFVVAEPLCRAVIGGTDSSPAIAHSTPIGAPLQPQPGARGCAGCASGCDAGWLVLIAVAALPRRRRARRPAPTARG